MFASPERAWPHTPEAACFHLVLERTLDSFPPPSSCSSQETGAGLDASCSLTGAQSHILVICTSRVPCPGRASC